MSIFDYVTLPLPKRSKQVLDHPLYTTTDFGKIVPVLLEDVLPGDTFKCKTAAEIKLFPTLAPLRQGIEVRIDYFFVPNRILWKDWKTFITGGEDGTAAPVKPFIDLSHGNSVCSLFDYFGLPVDLNRGGQVLQVSSQATCDALPFRAYSMIWNEYYRDQNLQDEVAVSLEGGEEGEDQVTNKSLLYRGLKKDYFTSALPWTQRGPQVNIPIAGEAPVDITLSKEGGIPDVISTNVNEAYSRIDSSSFANQDYDSILRPDPDNLTDAFMRGRSGTSYSPEIVHAHTLENPVKGVSASGTADLSDATAVSINELRRLNAVQKWLERNARAGSRYVEQILSHFGVRVPDYRLDRPEYIGGGKQTIGMAEILQTSETDTSPQGTRSGVGFGNMLTSSRKYFVQEHGWIIGLMSIVPQFNMYADGIHRKWTRTTKFDYFFKEFQNLGEQSILNQEIYAYNNSPDYDLRDDFGYTPRYAEYRYHPGIVTGEMRSSMSYWHMARMFNQPPALNGNFIDSSQNNTWDRLFPTDETLGDRFVVNMYHFERMRRPMQKNPQPSL